MRTTVLDDKEPLRVWRRESDKGRMTLWAHHGDAGCYDTVLHGSHHTGARFYPQPNLKVVPVPGEAEAGGSELKAGLGRAQTLSERAGMVVHSCIQRGD